MDIVIDALIADETIVIDVIGIDAVTGMIVVAGRWDSLIIELFEIQPKIHFGYMPQF